MNTSMYFRARMKKVWVNIQQDGGLGTIWANIPQDNTFLIDLRLIAYSVSEQTYTVVKQTYTVIEQRLLLSTVIE